MKKSLLGLVGTLVLGLSFAQNRHVAGFFPTYNQNGNISGDWDYSIYSFLAVYPFEQQPEGFIYPAKSNAFYIEADVSYGFSEEWSAAASYTYERVNPFRSDYRNENRLWLQAQHYNKFDRLNLKNRLRYDFRFIGNRATDETDYRPRLRYLLGIDCELSERVYFAAYNEWFFDTFSERIQAYSENWAFAGIGFSLSEGSRLETGPLLISWIRNAEADWLHQYFFQVTLVTTFNVGRS